MNFATTYRIALVAITASTFLISGCQSFAPTAEPTAKAEPVAEPVQPVGPQTASPNDVSLFGMHPDGERVPYENRLLTNMTQHTFTTIGRDFDPDIYRQDNRMVFASTRNSQHADIFYKTVDGYAITQLTSDPADDIQPRFSPDGTAVAFTSNRTGNWDIWVVNIDGTGLTQLTQDPGDEIAPCWSPDGKTLAFTSWGGRSRQWELWTLALDRPGVRQFLCYGLFPDWSPEGNKIAFQRARQRGTRWFSIWTVELVNGEARFPTEIAYSDSAACLGPRWSPEGDTIVYAAARHSSAVATNPDDVQADVWLVDAETGSRFKVTDGACGAFNPTWAASGRIYFVTGRAGVENVWSMQTDVTSYPVARVPQAAPTGQAGAQVLPNTPVETTGK